jgi:hypothetical protein
LKKSWKLVIGSECQCWKAVQCQAANRKLEESPVSQKISAVQPIGVSELQRVVDRAREEDFKCAIVQRMLLGAIRGL